MLKKEFVYLCGPTVYNKVHIGNMRPIVTFDLILRGLKYLNPNTIFIHNITDIDDKIIKQASVENVSEETISEKYYQYYLSMLNKFNIQTIDIMPKVTEHILDIENFIQKLLNKNCAYELNNSIYFNTSKFSNYGSVSNIKLDQIIQNNDDVERNNSFDFALWKNKTIGKNWNISIGQGRPGWHTECAVFIDKYTDHNLLKIHGGGIDLKFPHHENENIQYWAANNSNITSNWLHIGIINWKNQKMSKSLGNIIYAGDFLEMYDQQTNSADLFRLLILSSSYNATIELQDEMINSLIKKMNQIEKIINLVLIYEMNQKPTDDETIKFIASELSNYSFSKIYKELNTNIKKFNETKNLELGTKIFQMLLFLGFNVCNNQIDEETRKTYFQWQQEIKNKNFAKADNLRFFLMNKKII